MKKSAHEFLIATGIHSEAFPVPCLSSPVEPCSRFARRYHGHARRMSQLLSNRSLMMQPRLARTFLKSSLAMKRVDVRLSNDKRRQTLVSTTKAKLVRLTLLVELVVDLASTVVSDAVLVKTAEGCARIHTCRSNSEPSCLGPNRQAQSKFASVQVDLSVLSCTSSSILLIFVRARSNLLLVFF